MKRKIFSILFALVLVLSFSLVPAVPVAADPGYAGYTFLDKEDAERGPPYTSTSVWVDTETFIPKFGAYSVRLTPSTSGDYVQFVPQTGIKFSDLADITESPEWSFWYNYSGDSHEGNAGLGLELRFTGPDYVWPSKNEHVDITVNTVQPDEGAGWLEKVVDATSTAECYGNDGENKAFSDGTFGGDSTGGLTLAELVTAVTDLSDDALWDGSDPADWELTRVEIQTYEGEPTVPTVYVDDVTIDGTTYELEPIFLDKLSYNVGATVEVTVPNFAANTDPIRINPVTADNPEGTKTDWEVTVTSDSDTSGITVALEETGADTGVFTGSFATTDTIPAGEDELYVQEGDEITVTYDETGDWGIGTPAAQPADLTLTASVDDTAPTITVVFPEDGAQIDERTPEISATYEDDPAVSGIDEDSVEMFFDGVDVTDDATATTSKVTYTPEDDLVDGNYAVIVNVSDLAGNEATETWSFRVISWLEGSPVLAGTPAEGDLDALDTVGVAVSGATGADEITVGRYASNPEPDAALTFTTIEDGFFDVKVTDADTATQIVIKFADDNITADSVAYFWGDVEQEWIVCSNQGTTADYLWVKVRSDTTPSIVELGGTPFAISGEPAVEDILAYYKGLTGDAEVVDTTDLLTAANDWADAVVPPGFTEAISTTQLLALANEWAATE